MKKIFLAFIFFCLISIIFLPLSGQAKQCSSQTGIVKCGQDASCPCDLNDALTMVNDIYNFIVNNIATPLAIIALIVGGILLLISAGNPTLAGIGKKTLWAAIIGLALVFGAKAIIEFVKVLVGYSQTPSP